VNNTRKTDGFVPFVGTVDELLAHMENVDGDQVERVAVDNTEDVLLSDSESLALIKSESNLNDEQARSFLSEVKREEIDRALDNLKELGLIEVANYDSEGQPEYGLTDLGRQYNSHLKNTK
jgi:hypothetical protein